MCERLSERLLSGQQHSTIYPPRPRSPPGVHAGMQQLTHTDILKPIPVTHWEDWWPPPPLR